MDLCFFSHAVYRFDYKKNLQTVTYRKLQIYDTDKGLKAVERRKKQINLAKSGFELVTERNHVFLDEMSLVLP